MTGFLKRLLAGTRYEVRRRLPPGGLDAIQLVLEQLAAASPGTPTLVQIGACDGISNDPVHPYVRTGRFRALLVEPIPRSFARLQETYAGIPQVTLVQAAIIGENREITMYCVRPADGSTDHAAQSASLDRDHLLKHGFAPGQIQEITVPGKTLAGLTAECGFTQIDLLQIDAEGHDAAIVRMALVLPTPPASLNFEHIHLSDRDRRALYGDLARHGYRWIHDAMNTLAVREKPAPSPG